MGHEFISPLKQEDVLNGLEAESGKPVFVVAEKDEDVAVKAIREHWPKIERGAYMAFVDYHHKNVGLLRAVAREFSLMDVVVFPGSVAAVAK